MGLLKGTDKGLELDKVFTRAQGTVVVIRLLGLETTVLKSDLKSGFTDVKDNHWAAKFVAYARQNGIVHGTSPTTFHPDRQMNGKEFIALVLRGLGYKEASPDNAAQLAVQSGLLLEDEARDLTTKKVFLRVDMVNVVYNALRVKIKGQDRTLLQQLVEKGAVTKESALASGIYFEPDKNNKDAMDRIEEAIERALER